MATNLELRIAKLEALVTKLTDAGFKPQEVIMEISREETTEKTGDLIRRAYDSINTAIQKAKSEGDNDLVQKLIEMKKEVPKKYAISKQTMDELNTLLNQLVR